MKARKSVFLGLTAVYVLVCMSGCSDGFEMSSNMVKAQADVKQSETAAKTAKKEAALQAATEQKKAELDYELEMEKLRLEEKRMDQEHELAMAAYDDAKTHGGSFEDTSVGTGDSVD